ncbi:hypothetical protein Tco_0454143 [Tanacetum coccineum]
MSNACHPPMETKLPFDKRIEEAFDVDGTQRLSLLNAVRGSFKYLKGKTQLWIMVSRESPLDLGRPFLIVTMVVPSLTGNLNRYALTANPTIYDSLVKQFWQSAIASTKEDGFFEISATIDNIRYTITEASIRESLQLDDDATGNYNVPNVDIFTGMGQRGTQEHAALSQSNHLPPPPPIPSPTPTPIPHEISTSQLLPHNTNTFPTPSTSPPPIIPLPTPTPIPPSTSPPPIIQSLHYSYTYITPHLHLRLNPTTDEHI